MHAGERRVVREAMHGKQNAILRSRLTCFYTVKNLLSRSSLTSASIAIGYSPPAQRERKKTLLGALNARRLFRLA